MTRETLDTHKKGLQGYQGFFLALTLVVMIIIILIAKDLTAAILIIGLITNFLIITSQLTLMGDRHLEDQKNGDELARIDRDLDAAVMVNPPPSALYGSDSAGVLAASLATGEGMTGRPEKFVSVTTAPPGEGPPFWVTAPPGEEPTAYPGAIDFTEYETAPALGHTDWEAAARADVPVGNPFDDGRIAAPQAAPPCDDDDAIAYFDADELNTYQVRSRNVPERVWAGIYRRKALVERYVGEELDEQEDTQWWGRHEV